MSDMQGFDLLVDMLAVEPLVVLNAAFCELHRKRCPPSEQLLRECAYVRSPALLFLARPDQTRKRAEHTSCSSDAVMNGWR